MNTARQLAERRQLLIAAADLERVQLALAWHDVRVSLAPQRVAARNPFARSLASMALGVAIPLFGRSRMGRIMRGVSVALAALRVARAFTQGRR